MTRFTLITFCLCALTRLALGNHCYGSAYQSCGACTAGTNCAWCPSSCSCVMAPDASRVCIGTFQSGSQSTCAATCTVPTPSGEKYFTSITSKLTGNSAQRHYGVAVADSNQDGKDEFIITGNGAPNRIYSYDKNTDTYVNIIDGVTNIEDTGGKAIGVSACDVDGDGNEEVFILNTDAYQGPTTKTSVRLFKHNKGSKTYTDLFTLDRNQKARAFAAGRSVACLDRNQDGRYGVVLANYNIPFYLYELDKKTDSLSNVATEAGIDGFRLGGRALVVGPVVSDFRTDLFANNENGGNRFFTATDTEVFAADSAKARGIADVSETGRGTVLADVNDDGLLDIVYGNWVGPHRMMIQKCDGTFENFATKAMALASPVRTVIAADFDNDGYQELFYNNIPGRNRLFSRAEYSRRRLHDGNEHGDAWEQINIGEALEESMHGTGAGIADLDGDGRLELLISHGESASEKLTLYKSDLGKGNKFLRVRPLTAAGAPARGSTVRLHHKGGRKQLQVIDSGSGYLCQQEPVAHFGLGDASGKMAPVRVVVRWPDSTIVVVDDPPSNCGLTVPHPGADAKKGDSVTIASKCLGDAKAGTVQGRVAPELGSIRASVCPSDTKTDVHLTRPQAQSKPLVKQSDLRTKELRQAQVLVKWGGETVNDLHDEYMSIFHKTNNRNAASHLWSSFVLRRSMQMEASKIRELMSGFCSVSGSIVRPGPNYRYKVTVDRVEGASSEGFLYFCCWPCACDAMDLIRVDTLTVPTAKGDVQMEFQVIGDPCLDPNAIPSAASELECKDSKLQGATYSDHGFVIIGMIYPVDKSVQYREKEGDNGYGLACESRARQGYAGGMGEIFRTVAGINKAPQSMSVAPATQAIPVTTVSPGSNSGDIVITKMFTTSSGGKSAFYNSAGLARLTRATMLLSALIMVLQWVVECSH